MLLISDSIAKITINRPEALNALNLEVLHGLDTALHELSQKSFDEVRVVELRGAGDKAFVAGADIKLMAEASPAELAAFIELGQRVMRRIEQLPFPVIAVVDGFAIGGGMELALACDFIVASSKAKLGQAEVNLGLIPGFGGTQRLFHRVGTGWAKRLIMTGENIGGEQAAQIGLVDWLAAPEELESSVAALSKTLMQKGPIAIASAKRSIEAAFEQQKLSGLTQEVEAFRALFGYQDTKEGLQAFIEKRPAKFLGK